MSDKLYDKYGYLNAITVGDEVVVWYRKDGKRHYELFPAPFNFYVEDERGEFNTLDHKKARFFQFGSKAEFAQAIEYVKAKGKQLYESDISPEIKKLMELYDSPLECNWKIAFIDIEVNYDPKRGFSGVENPYGFINSLVLFHYNTREYVIIAIPPTQDHDVEKTKEYLLEEIQDEQVNARFYFVESERELLIQLLKELRDVDVVSGWNSEFFDLPYIALRIEKTLGREFLRLLSFSAGDLTFMPYWKEVNISGRTNKTINLVGRVHYDYLQLFKKYERELQPSYKLDYIGEKVLGLNKVSYSGSLAELYKNQFDKFVRYNIRDVEILYKLEDKLQYIDVSKLMYLMSLGLPQHVQGTLKLHELAIIKHAHEEFNVVVNDLSVDESTSSGGIKGAFVIPPKPGMHEWVFSIDITSLYPSVIRTLNLSPDVIVATFSDGDKDFQRFHDDPSAFIAVEFEHSKDVVTKTAAEWKQWMLDNGYHLSPAGVITDGKLKGIIPEILTLWFNQRLEYKKKKGEAKTPDEESFFDRMQYIFKIKLNSLYGALNNKYFRFFDKRLGESITGSGRLIIQHQVNTVNKELGGKYEIGEYAIYGDTDSAYATCNHLIDKSLDEEQQLEQAVRIADSVAERVNSTFNDFIHETFLINSQRFFNIIQTSREVVARRGIFIEKKRYVLFVLDNEGKRVEKLKPVGVDIVRTTISEDVKAKMKELLIYLLKTNDWDRFNRMVVDYKTFLESTDSFIDLFGIITSVSNFEEYNMKYKVTGKTHAFPFHIKAALHFNLALKEYNDTETPEIKSGDKIRVFYLKREFFGRFNTIALPIELDEMPRWFKDVYLGAIHKKLHIERVFDAPLNNILKAVGKTTATKTSILFDQLFQRG